MKEVSFKSQSYFPQLSLILQNKTKLSSKCKREEYLCITPEEKAQIAKYVSENGVTQFVKHYKDKNLKKSTVKKFTTQVGENYSWYTMRNVIVLLCHYHLKYVEGHHYLVRSVERLQPCITPVRTSVVATIGQVILLKHDKKEFVRSISLEKD